MSPGICGDIHPAPPALDAVNEKPAGEFAAYRWTGARANFKKMGQSFE
jgi:hypothetical protein